MVLPSEEREVIGKTLEDRLADKFDILQIAREQRNEIAFDEVARSIEVLLKVSQLVTDFPEIVEMDINPLFVKEKGKGSIAGDVRIRIQK